MLRLRPTPTPQDVRLPIIEPVTTMPGVPAVPGELRYPVPTLAQLSRRRTI